MSSHPQNLAQNAREIERKFREISDSMGELGRAMKANKVRRRIDKDIKWPTEEEEKEEEAAAKVGACAPRGLDLEAGAGGGKVGVDGARGARDDKCDFEVRAEQHRHPCKRAAPEPPEVDASENPGSASVPKRRRMQRLEKLNSSIDIIPLQNPSQDIAARRPNNMKPNDKARAEEAKVFRDPMIISRVRSYLYENEDKVYIDVTEMADFLQRKYRDYRAKKRGPFRAMVRRAYDEITENITRQTDSHWQDDEDEIDIEVDAMPAEYLSTYKRQTSGRQNGNSSDKELIDISSDDDSTKAAPVPHSSKPQKESMEVEPTQVSKRPHLCSSVDTHRAANQRPQDFSLDMQNKNRQERSRKRPRERDEEAPIEPISFKKRAKQIPLTNPTVKFSDVGGNSKILETVANLVLHIKHPEVYAQLGIAPPRGFLLHGPPGCGKTLLAHAIAGELKVPLLKVAAPELVAGVSGESEQRIRELFEQAIAIGPCILFLDEIDAVAPHRATAQKEMERRIVSQLLSSLDELGLKDGGNKVLVIGATNRPDSLDPALRRAGRFDREVSLGIPDKDARAAILRIHTSNVTLSPEVDLQKVASLTPGFVGADLVALVREAAMVAVNRAFDGLKKMVTVDAASSRSVEKDVLQIPQKPLANSAADTSDIIIEEEPAKNTETSEPGISVDNNEDEQKPDDSVTVEESKVETPSESIKQSEPTSEQSETLQASVKSPPTGASHPESVTAPTTVAASEEATSAVADVDVAAAAATTESTVAPAVSEQKSVDAPVDTVTADPAVSAVEVDPEPEPVDSMQVEEPEKKLTDILSWLHNEPPLSEEQLALLCIEERDFELALKNVQPSAKREGFATVPDVTWDDIGSLQDIRQELQMTIMAPIRHSEQFATLGLNTPTGVLLCGPPGCGKTLLAKAIANEAGINFISVKGPELLNMYVGESEKAVRQCFLRARNSAPCVIFFDELDSLCPKRSEGDSTATSRVVNQMLTEMDGVEGRKDVFLMAASNRPDIIDPAVLRPGRLDKILYVGLPNPNDRVDILRALTKNGTKPKLAADIDLEAVAGNDRCIGYTGADLAALVREAGVEALREIMSGFGGPTEIAARHFEIAFDKVRPSVQEKDMKHYEKLQRLYSVRKPLSNDVPMSVEPLIDTTMEAMET